ncbi:MAG: hypothetical protein ACPGSE_00305 [Synechococcus sp.]
MTKTTRASLLVDQLIADGWTISSKLELRAKIAGLIFSNPKITDAEIGEILASTNEGLN